MQFEINFVHIVVCLKITDNGLQLGEVADFEALTFKLALMFI